MIREELEKIKIESAGYKKAVNYLWALIIFQVVWVFLALLYEFEGEHDIIFYILIAIFRGMYAYQGAKIARDLNRSPGIIAVCFFVLPIPALLVTYWMGEKFDDDETERCVCECRKIYESEKKQFLNNTNLHGDELTAELEKIKEKHTSLLHKKLNKIRMEIRKWKEDNEPEITHGCSCSCNAGTNDSGEPQNLDMTECPACGHEIKPEDLKCPDCELNIR